MTLYKMIDRFNDIQIIIMQIGGKIETQIGENIDKYIFRQVDKYTNRQIDRRIDRYIDRWKDRQIERQISTFVNTASLSGFCWFVDKQI